MIESVSPGPHQELFGRKHVPGWTVFGDQVELGWSKAAGASAVASWRWFERPAHDPAGGRLDIHLRLPRNAGGRDTGGMEAPAQQTSQVKAARSRRRWLQFSLRWLLVIVTVSGIGLGLVVSRVERQRQAVAAIRGAGGVVFYDFEDPTSPVPAVRGELPGPDWLCRLLGVDYFAEVTKATLPGATDATVAHLSGLTSLKELSLYSTQVSDAGLAHLSQLTSLQGLRLGGTQVRDAGLAHLSRSTSLQRLSLNGTQVTDGGLVHLSGLTSLQGLNLQGTQVGDAGVAHLSGLTSLQALNLRGTQVTDMGLAHLRGLTSLQSLFLSGTQVTDAGLAHLSSLTSLQGVELSRTQVTDAGLAHLSGLTSLVWLHLDGTQVSDAGLPYLSRLTSLQGLFLVDTQVMDAGCRQLRAALPKCAIVY
ncbi:MAG: hypothetical protein WD847_04565 [Pirellulales bacterium]